jgi:transcriptional regulator with XRE-family HTH domain
MSDDASALLFGVPSIHDNQGNIRVTDLVELLHISQAQLARILGVSRQLLSQSPTSPRIQKGLRQLEYLFARVNGLTGSVHNTLIWLKMGHPDLDGVAPLELLEEGLIEEVQDLVLAIETGLPG